MRGRDRPLRLLPPVRGTSSWAKSPQLLAADHGGSEVRKRENEKRKLNGKVESPLTLALNRALTLALNRALTLALNSCEVRKGRK